MACYITKDSSHHVAICVLWLNLEKYQNVFDNHNYNMLGNCRTKPGLQLMASTLWQHPEVTDLIVVTNEPHGMLSFLQDDAFMLDVNPEYNGVALRLHHQKLSEINTNIPKADIVRPYFECIKKEVNLSDRYWPSSPGYLAKANSIRQLYQNIMHLIYRRGTPKVVRDSSVMDLSVATLTLHQNVSDMKRELEYYFPEAILQDYIDQFARALDGHNLSSNGTYNYPDRIVKYLPILLASSSTRMYCPIFWPDDLGKTDTPCCVGMQLLHRTVEEVVEIDMVILFRSNDMLSAWPLNMLGFRYLQTRIVAIMNGEDVLAGYTANGNSYRIGYLTSVSNSAHYYGDPPQFSYTPSYDDPEGYYVISAVGDTISVDYFTPSAELVTKYSFDKAYYEEKIEEITKTITNSSHAAYVAKEITKKALTYEKP